MSHSIADQPAATLKVGTTVAGSTPSRGAGLRLRGLSKSFGSKPVLRDIDLDIAPESFVAIVGKSGCGKSTLLRLIAHLDEPTGGRLEIAAGQTGSDVRIMFQEPRLLPWAHVEENVRVGLGSDRAAPEARREAQALLEAVGLGDRGGDWPSVLSGGQKQRVALARALVTSPNLLVLDEPLGALDALTRIEMQQLLEQIWLERRFTAILVTHDVAEALALADRIIEIDAGRIDLDLVVDLPRPRRRGAPEFAKLEEQILDRLLGRTQKGLQAA